MLDTEEAFAAVDNRDDRKTANLWYTQGRARALGSKICDHASARAVLKEPDFEQAGFDAALVKKLPLENTSILFKTGDDHRRHRSSVASLFAPAAVATYRPRMEAISDRLVRELAVQRTFKLDDVSLAYTTAVAAEIVGLTERSFTSLGIRLSKFFDDKYQGKQTLVRTALFLARSQVNICLVYLLDVAPALRRRRLEPKHDLISLLIQHGWSRFDILVECITYATAGISTTREFIVVAAWHLAERKDVLAVFLAGTLEDKMRLVDELLRLEPPVGAILRKARHTRSFQAEKHGRVYQDGDLISIDVREVNADRHQFGDNPNAVRAAPPNAIFKHMSFGDGVHRCPGSSVALQETAIFLDRLFRLRDLKLKTTPSLRLNALTAGYVLRDAIFETSGDAARSD